MLACLFCMCAWLWVALPPSHTATTTPLHRCAATAPALLKWHGWMCCPKIRPTHPPTFNSLNTKISCILKPHMECWHTPFHTGTTHTFSLVSGHTASVADMHTTRHTTTSFASHHNGVCATPCLIHPFPHKYNTYFPLAFGQSSSVAAA